MSEPILPVGAAQAPWADSERRVRVPDSSLLPGSEKAPPPVVGLLKNAVQGAHATIDRLAGRAAPVAQRLRQRVSQSGGALQARRVKLVETRDEWAESTRATVRSNPLASVAVAALLGALIGRITR